MKKTKSKHVAVKNFHVWTFEEQEKLLEFYERISGAKMHASFIPPGGVAQDPPLGVCLNIDSSTQQFASRINELEEMSTEKPYLETTISGCKMNKL
ncbi:unnamed protein product [Ilex paraguariensis]|uniref:NADH-quinone oxidoreductase subunit D domain-containing protein n=1 Tax=Ilex paraguariensis TaxID=185542 RepID=A0ABC8QTI5_9AQUA